MIFPQLVGSGYRGAAPFAPILRSGAFACAEGCPYLPGPGSSSYLGPTGATCARALPSRKGYLRQRL